MNGILYSKFDEYTMRDLLSCADMRDSVASGTGKPVYASDDGAMVFQEESGLYMLAADSDSAAAPMLDMLESPEMVLTHLDTVVTAIQRRFDLPMDMYCRQYVYTRERPLTVEPPIGVKLRPLTEDDLRYVLDNYRNDNDPEYIASRIEYGMTGAVYNDKLCGFIGCHGEGSLGLLFVAPECRRLGIGEALLSAGVNRRINEGRIPYTHAVLGNTASMRLQEKNGFTAAEKPAVWMFRD